MTNQLVIGYLQSFLTGHFQSFIISHPTLNPKKKSRKFSNKKNLALSNTNTCIIWSIYVSNNE